MPGTSALAVGPHHHLMHGHQFGLLLRLFLLMHGKGVNIPEGTEIHAFINGDVKLDLSKFAH